MLYDVVPDNFFSPLSGKHQAGAERVQEPQPCAFRNEQRALFDLMLRTGIKLEQESFA